MNVFIILTIYCTVNTMIGLAIVLKQQDWRAIMDEFYYQSRLKYCIGMILMVSLVMFLTVPLICVGIIIGVIDDIKK